MGVTRTTEVVDGVSFEDADFAALIDRDRPCILKGALQDAPLVVAGRESVALAKSFLLETYADRKLLVYMADREAGGRFFYTAAMDGLNFQTAYLSLAEFLEELEKEQTASAGRALYVGSADLPTHFPGLTGSDGISLKDTSLEQYAPRAGIWLGNRTTAATHFDVSNNVAACMVGRRRFTLFPPDQIENLYPGPLEPTPGGQVVSMVDLNAPDLTRFPKIKQAFEHGQVAELEAGDVLVYPAMWWHQAEALASFNVLMNFWWNPVASHIDDPMTTLLHGMLSLRDRPDAEKAAWREVFEYYVFGDSDRPRSHLPPNIRGALGPIDELTGKRLRVAILKKLNR